LLDERIRIPGDCCCNQLRCYLDRSRRLNKMSGRSQANGAMSFAVVTACLIHVRGERGAGQEKDNRQGKRQKPGASLTVHVLHVHLQGLDDS
jgi:hypothetical protein